MHTREFYVYRGFIEALMRSGVKRLVEWYPHENGGKNPDDRIGMYISFDAAENLLMKYRKSGVGPQQVHDLLEAGAVQL